jgi:predicted dehydrogenase
MAKELTIGIIGNGAIGNVHADAFRATGAGRLAALCDVDPAKLAATGDKFGVPAAARFSDYRQLLASDVDAVLVCVPNAFHAEMAVAALQAGKHVLLEKPCAMNAEQAAKIVAAAKKAKGVIQVGMVWRQRTQPQTLREYIAAGRLGKIYHLRAVMIRRRGIPGLGGWFTTRELSGGGPMIDLGVHWFDMSMWLSGLWQPTSVSAKTFDKFGPRMKNYRYVSMWAGPPKFDGRFDVEDYSTGFARFGAEATLSFEIAWAANAESESFVEVLGDQGGARVGGTGPLVIRTEDAGHVADLTPQLDESAKPFEVQARKFAAACRGDGPVEATIEQGHTVMKLIDAIYESSRTNAEVAIR